MKLPKSRTRQFLMESSLSETAKRMLDDFDLNREIARNRPWPEGLSYEQALDELDAIVKKLLAILRRQQQEEEQFNPRK
jgi:hypothetical protein